MTCSRLFQGNVSGFTVIIGMLLILFVWVFFFFVPVRIFRYESNIGTRTLKGNGVSDGGTEVGGNERKGRRLWLGMG